MVLTDKKLFYLGVVNLNRNWWSTSTGIGWSVSTGTGGQFKLVSGGLFDWIFQADFSWQLDFQRKNSRF